MSENDSLETPEADELPLQQDPITPAVTEQTPETDVLPDDKAISPTSEPNAELEAPSSDIIEDIASEETATETEAQVPEAPETDEALESADDGNAPAEDIDFDDDDLADDVVSSEGESFEPYDEESFDMAEIDFNAPESLENFQEELPDAPPYMQNRELSWLSFNERVLDQGADETVPLLARLNFISIFWSNLQEFFMVRVGSLTDLSYIEPPLHDSKTNMTPKEQIIAIHERCHELYPIQERIYERVRGNLAREGVRHLRPNDLSAEQREYLVDYMHDNIEPFLSPQIINPLHPFPHLENGKLYILVRLDEEMSKSSKADSKGDAKKKKKAKKVKERGADGVVLGLIPLPHQCDRVIKLPGKGFPFILLEHVIEMFAENVFSMYNIKHVNVICVTRNADLDASRTNDGNDEDYREHMKRYLRLRKRLAPVRLECEAPLSPVMTQFLLQRLNLEPYQVYDTTVPLDLSFTWGLGDYLSEKKRARLADPAFTPQWPVSFDSNRPIIDQVSEHETLLMYPYESMDPFVQLLREAANDPSVISIKITLYRLARQSHLAEALIAAAENGKEVTALFELRARFDEANNIEWSQRFEQAGCNVIYGFENYKVHSKICCITRQTPNGIQYITQLGTGNYNEKTAKLYTDISFITTDKGFGLDAVEFFRNMGLESISDHYQIIQVAPLQIKQTIKRLIDQEIKKAKAGKPSRLFFKTNSVTDTELIEKIAQASQAGVPVTMLVRGICCLVPRVPGYTDNVRVYSIVGKLLEHSRIFCFGTDDDCKMFLSSADLMTRNMDKRVEIAWPVFNDEIRGRILDYINTTLHDTAKLRELMPDGTYTPLGVFVELDSDGNPLPFDSQNYFITAAHDRLKQASIYAAYEDANKATTTTEVSGTEDADAAGTSTTADAAPVEATEEPGAVLAEHVAKEEDIDAAIAAKLAEAASSVKAAETDAIDQAVAAVEEAVDEVAETAEAPAGAEAATLEETAITEQPQADRELSETSSTKEADITAELEPVVVPEATPASEHASLSETVPEVVLTASLAPTPVAAPAPAPQAAPAPAPATAQTAQATPTSAAVEEQKPKRRGFFARLFGRQ